ncbi:MAG: sugar phosphate isomerase/epimerase family protein [Bacteroidota bacterium]
MTRKNFLRYSAATAAGMAIAPQLMAKTEPTRPLLYKSLKFGMIKEELSIMDKFKLIKDLGFDGVELDGPHELDHKAILKARDKTGIQIPGLVNSLHWKKPLSHPDPVIRAECVESVKTAMRLTKEYGGTTVLLVPAVVNGTITYKDAYERSQKEIKKLIPYAEETGIKIALENVWNNFLISPLEAAQYVDSFESEMIGWYFDVGNVVRYGWPAHWIEALGHRIMKIDVKEYSRKKQSDEGIWEGFKVKLGDGDSDWASVNQALSLVGYQGWGSAEVAGGDRKRLAEISERMDKIYAL